MAHVPLFKQLTKPQIAMVSQLIRAKTVQAGQFVFMEEEPLEHLIVLRSGKIKLIRYADGGEERILDVLAEGDFYTGEPLFYRGVARETAVAMVDCQFCTIPTRELAQLILKEPEIGLKMIQYYSELTSRYRAMHEILATKDALKRVVLFLLERSKRVSSSRISLSQEEIAHSINLTQETVNRKLSELKKAGMIAIAGHRSIRIRNATNLQAYIQEKI